MNTIRIAALTLIAASFVSNASAVTYRWTFSSATHVDGAQPGGGDLYYNNDGGRIDSIETTYNASSKRLTYDVTFSKAAGQTTKTSGYWLALNSGPNPKGTAGELALLYFDASSSTQPVLTAYGYNGVNGFNSYKDGKPDAGTQTPDFILSSKTNSSWVNDISVSHVGEKTRMKFDIDATSINVRTPLHGPASGWTGAQFNEKFGVWFHPVRGLQTEYNQNGSIKNWHQTNAGYLDGSNMEAVPEPATMLALSAGCALLARRRRKA